MDDASQTGFGVDETAFLIVRDGRGQREVFQLQPSQVTTIGRAATNRIVLKDEVCSRHHCEIFRAGDEWIIRDLGSRNGTLLSRGPLIGDSPLADGTRVRIGGLELIFTTDPARPIDEEPLDRETHAAADSPEILHRRKATRFGELARRDNQLRDRVSQELARLYRLAIQLGVAAELQTMCGETLDVLLASTPAGLGAVLVADGPGTTIRDFRTVCSRGGDAANEGTSESLSQMVLSCGEAVLGSDVPRDARLASRDSLGRLRARSVLCTPIRYAGAIRGLIHLYALDPDNPLGVDDLEFTLAAADQLGVAIGNFEARDTLAANLNKAQSENQNLREQLRVESDLVGGSEAIARLREEIGRAAPTDATILIRGESGVGKELVARAIHVNSRRHAGPFVTLNCAALSESLLESELFGHEKGSFTGATGRKIGKFEAADEGTLFLDEVGEMSQSIQSKFLRVLEGHAFERVGGNQTLRTNVRVVAATNRDLEQAVEAGSFRRDLYFRLHVIVVTVDPLRQRPGDIDLLATHFLKQVAGKIGRPVPRFSNGALSLLRNYEWPGNVRELRNTIERAVILSRGEVLDVADIRLTPLASGAPLESLPAAGTFREIPLDRLEREHILAVLESTDHNKSRAAQILGIERSTLDRKLKRYRAQRPGEV